jgi:hypothetical protein
MNLIKSIDFLGNEPKVYIFKRNLYKTFLGGLLSIITAAAIGSFTLYFITIAFSRQQVNLLSSQTTKFNKSLDLGNIPFLLFPANKDGVFFNTSVVYPVLQLWSYPHKSQGSVKITNVPLKQCETSDLTGYNDLFADFTNLNSYYCMNKAGLNLTIFGDYGDINNGYSKLHINIAKCTNDSIYNINPDKQGCLAQDKIDGLLGNYPLHLYLTYPDYEIDFQNLTNPFRPYIKTEDFLISYMSKNAYIYYFKRAFINSDFGYVFEDTHQQYSYQYDSMLSLTLMGSTLYVPEGYGLIMITLSSIADIHSRSYIKLQSMVANVGGVINFIYLLAKIIVGYISNKTILLEYVNYSSRDYKPSTDIKPNGDQQLSKISIKASENTGTYAINTRPVVVPFNLK